MTTKAVQLEWSRRVEAEHGSASATAELLSWLLQLGFSDDLVLACHGIVDDEIRHARLSLEVLRAAGGDVDTASRSRVALPVFPNGRMPVWQRALRVTSSMFCCGESAAVGLFHAMHAAASVPLAKSALRDILKDEGRHRAFGWTLLTAMVGRTGATARLFVAKYAEDDIAELRAAYDGTFLDPSSKEKAWGLISPAAYRRSVEDTIRREIAPRFADIGIEFRPRARVAVERAASNKRITR